MASTDERVDVIIMYILLRSFCKTRVLCGVVGSGSWQLGSLQFGSLESGVDVDVDVDRSPSCMMLVHRMPTTAAVALRAPRVY